MDHDSLEELSQYLTDLLDGLHDTLTACAAQKKQCPMTCSQRKGFIEAANAIVAVVAQITEEQEVQRGLGKITSPSALTLADFTDSSSIALLRRQLEAVHGDGDLLQQFIHRYHPDTKLERGTSPTITASRVADLLKVKQTFRSLEINLHDVEQLFRIVYRRVFETPSTSPANESAGQHSSHSSEFTVRPHDPAVESRYVFQASESDDNEAAGEREEEHDYAGDSSSAPPTRATTGIMTTPPDAGTGQTPQGATSVPPLYAESHDGCDDAGNDVSGAPPRRSTLKLNPTISTLPAVRAPSPREDESQGEEEEEEPDARPVEMVLGESGAPPRHSTNTLPYVRGSHSQAMPSLSLNRSEIDVRTDTDGTDNDFSGPRVSSPRHHGSDNKNDDDAPAERLSTTKPRATARLFTPVEEEEEGRGGTPPLHPGHTTAASSAARPPAVTAPPSLTGRSKKIVTTQHSYRMPGELWVSLCESIPDEVEACFVEDVLNALNVAAPPNVQPRPAIADDQVADVRLSSLEQFLYIRFAVEHDRYEYPKKDIDDRVSRYTFPMMTQLYEEAFHAQRAREEAELDRFDSLDDDVFLDVVSSSRSRRGSSSQLRRDSVTSVSSALLLNTAQEDGRRGSGSRSRQDPLTADDGQAMDSLQLAVPSADTLADESSPLSTNVLSNSRTASGSLPSTTPVSTSVTSADAAGQYRVKLPGRHWPTVLFFISKPMLQPVMVEEVSLATGVALKAVAGMALSVGSLCADFCIDPRTAEGGLSASGAPATWPSCSEFVLRALESHDFALIHQQYTTACEDLFLRNDLPPGESLFAEEVLGPQDLGVDGDGERDDNDGGGRGSSGSSRHSHSRTSRRASVTAAAAHGAVDDADRGRISYFTLPPVGELDASAASLPGSQPRPPKSASSVTPASATDRQVHSTPPPQRSSVSSHVYASSLGARPDTPDNEPITLLHLALENDVTVAQLKAYNPHLAYLDDDDPLPDKEEDLAVTIPRPAWLYEEDEDAAVQSVTSAVGTPVRPGEGGGSNSSSARAQREEAAPPSPTAARAPTGAEAVAPGGPRRTSVVSANTRQESISSVTSSTRSMPSSATARLRKRQQLHFVDPAVESPPVRAEVVQPATELGTSHTPPGTDATNATTKTAAESAPIDDDPHSQEAPPAHVHKRPVAKRASLTAAGSSASSGPAPVVANVSATYRHLTTPSTSRPSHAVTVATGRDAESEASAAGEDKPSAALTTTTTAASAVLHAQLPPPTSASAPSTGPQPRPVASRGPLPPPMTRPLPFAGVPTAGEGDAPRGGNVQGHAKTAQTVPQRAHPKAPLPPSSSSPASVLTLTAPARTEAAPAATTASSAPVRRARPRPASVPPPVALLSSLPLHSASPTPVASAVPAACSVIVPVDGRPRLGLRLDKNLIIASLTRHGAAAESGMSVGAQIRTVNGKPLRTPEEFLKQLQHAAAQPLPSVVLITTSRPTAEAQGAAWSEDEDTSTPQSAAAAATPASRDVRTHWIRLVSGAPDVSAESPEHTTAVSPRGRRADAPVPATSATSRAAAYQRVRSHSANPPAVGTALDGAAVVGTGAPPQSSHTRPPRASSGTSRRPHRAATSARSRRHDSVDETGFPAPRSAVPMPTPMTLAPPPVSATGARTRVRSRSAHKTL